MAGETASHVPPVLVVAVAVKAKAPPPDKATEIVCACGAAPPIWKLTGASVTGVTMTVGPPGVPPPTVRLTWKVITPDAVVAVTVPVYPPGKRPRAFTLTLTLPTVPDRDGRSQF